MCAYIYIEISTQLYPPSGTKRLATQIVDSAIQPCCMRLRRWLGFRKCIAFSYLTTDKFPDLVVLEPGYDFHVGQTLKRHSNRQRMRRTWPFYGRSWKSSTPSETIYLGMLDE